MIKRALLVGIDAYSATPLIGCEGDARNLETLLSTNEDASPNFDCKALLSSSSTVTRGVLREHLNELFASEADVALFYFSGHGALVPGRGGVLVTQDARNRDEGVDMAELLALANERRVREVVLIIDCCFGGAIGQLVALDRDAALLREGMAILAASRADQTAAATPNGSVFTNLVRGALIGGAADPVGKVTVASVYAYVEQTLTAWEQRPMFKANLARLTALRQCKPEIELEVLRRLPDWFPTNGYEYQLDPSYEPEAEPKHPAHEEIFSCFQRLRNARLLCCVGEQHLYYAALNSKRCKLSQLGEFYRDLAAKGRL